MHPLCVMPTTAEIFCSIYNKFLLNSLNACIFMISGIDSMHFSLSLVTIASCLIEDFNLIPCWVGSFYYCLFLYWKIIQQKLGYITIFPPSMSGLNLTLALLHYFFHKYLHWWHCCIWYLSLYLCTHFKDKNLVYGENLVSF